MKILRRWITILRTTNIDEPVENLDVISRWLLASRASVGTLTVTAFLIGLVLALYHSPKTVSALDAIITFVVLMMAHLASNLIDDYYDYRNKVDTDASPRMKYTRHFMKEGFISVKGFWAFMIAFLVIGILVGVYFSLKYHSITPFIIGGIGALIVFGYVAPPLRLKYHAFGELAIAIAWGPLMVGATYYTLTGVYDWKTLLMSIPYGILVGAVIMGKHLDKYDHDSKIPVKTLPVVMGKRAAVIFTAVFMVIAWLMAIVLAIFDYYPVWTIPVMIIVIPFLWQSVRNYVSPPKEASTENTMVCPFCPLWYVVFAYKLSQRLGWALIISVLIALFLPDIKLWS